MLEGVKEIGPIQLESEGRLQLWTRWGFQNGQDCTTRKAIANEITVIALMVISIRIRFYGHVVRDVELWHLQIRSFNSTKKNILKKLTEIG